MRSSREYMECIGQHCPNGACYDNENVFICTVRYSSHWPHEASAAKELELDFFYFILVKFKQLLIVMQV